MNRTKKHLIHTLLVILILLVALFILGDTSFEQVTRSIPQVNQTAAVADFNSSLVAHYTFDDGTATDSAGSHNGTLVGGPTPVAGKVGSGALQFDGADDVVTASIPHSTSGLSVSMWIKTNTSTLQTLFSRGTVSNGYVFRYIFGNRFDFGHDGVTDLSSRTNSFNTLASNTWYHVVMTWDGSTSAANVNFYKDGAVLSRDYTVDGASLSDVSGLTVSIGSTFNGTIDDVRVYNRALSAAEVSDLYASGGGTTPPPASTPANPAPPANPPANQTPPTAQSTVSAATCGDRDVQAAIDAVANQGVVLVPAGTCTWTKPVSATGKSLIVKGAGIDQTTIIEDISPDGGALFFDPKFGELVRLTGFTFDGSKTIRSRATISVHGLTGQPSSRFRIDHNKFVNVTQRGIIAYGAYGLIDHNTFIRTTSSSYTPTLISVIGDPNSWSRPQDLGTSNAVFMEDNIFVQSIQANGPFDMYTGARYVFRHNTVYGNGMGHHGFDSSVSGIVNFEIYDNTITNASPTGEPYGHGIVFEFRSGSGVIFNNTVKRGPVMGNNGGYYDGFGMLRNYRSGDGFLTNYGYAFPWNGTPAQGVCDGNSSYDGNLAGMKGYPCRDQIGRTSGTAADGKQTFSPVYSWNNSFEQGKSGPAVVGGHLFVQGYAPPPVGGSERVFEHIVEGRDYFNGTPRPGYTPYTYPHPLTLSGFTSDAGGPVITVPVGNPAPATPPQTIIPPVTPPVVPPIVPPVIPPAVTPPPVVPPVTVIPPVTLPPTTPTTPAVPSIISRILPSFTSPTRTPTTPSNVTKPKTPSGPFVPLPEATPEDVASSSERTSFTATIKDIFSYIVSRISNGFKRVFKSTSLLSLPDQTAAVYNVAQDSPELLSNGSMESATAWNDSGGTTQARSNEQAHGGTYSWKVSYPSCCGWAGVSNSLNIPNVSAGQIYRLSGWVYVTSGSVRVAIKDFSNHILGSAGVTTLGSWQYAEAYATIPSGVTEITATALFDNSSGTFYMDDFSLKLATSGTDTGTGGGGTTPPPTTVVDTPAPPAPDPTPVPDNPTTPTITGDQIAAASCSRTDVQVAFDAAKTGDTVTIPAGTCTWTSVFNFNKAVTLKGAGIGQTTIINGVSHASDPNTGTHPQIMVMTSSSAGLTRLTNMTIDGGSGGSDSQNNGFMKIQGSSKNWRIDHVRFVITRTSALHVWAPGGVIDHNRFDLVGWYMAIYGFNGGGGNGDQAWAQPTNLGTDDALYIEDNIFYSTTPSLGLDGWVGQRVVVRYNNFNNSRVGNHGTESSQRQRGARSYEIYNNTFTLSNTSNYSDAIGVRSGVGVIFNNTLSGAFTMVGSMHNYRDPHPYPPWGQCDGTSPSDLNDVNDDGTTKVYDSGVSSLSASSVNQSITLTAQKAWAPGQWVGYTIWNTRTNVKSPISSNTATTIVGYTDNTNNGTPLSWSVNDPFKIVRASVCLDQVGRGKGDLISGSSPTPQAWPHQELDPTYIWNNTLKGSVQSIGDTSVHIVENRDYYNNTCKPGYTPYTYPHPLTGLPAQSVPLNCSGGGQSTNYVPIVTPPITPPVTPPVVPPIVPPVIPPAVTPPPVVPPVTVIPPVTLPPSTPAVPSIISRILPSFTSPTRTPTTPSSVTTRRTTPSGPFVPLPEATPEDIASSTERTSFTATIRDILSYILSRIERGIQRVVGR